ncbi:GPP34 family phosphoprotein [Actinoplanes sp. NPDC089786]|uniref:GPP34 family phosphoprotein n=1 Tax=Actinoplanes sp. NPDC089786 TaxID=3155185 RepID=UPI003421D976
MPAGESRQPAFGERELWRFADRAYWLVHDDLTGALRTSPRVADLTVAAAVFAELICVEALTCHRDSFVIEARPRLVDALGQKLLAAVARRSGPLPAVINDLAAGLRLQVRQRLLDAGLAEHRRMGWLRRSTVVAPDRYAGPAGAAANLARRVASGPPFPVDDLVLLHLLQQCHTAGNAPSSIPAQVLTAELHETSDIDPYRALLRAARAIGRAAQPHPAPAA